MSIKKAQNIVNQVQDRLGISMVAYQNSELEWLKNQLEKFLDLEVETEELSDPDDLEAMSDSDIGDDDDEDYDRLSHDSDDGYDRED